MTASARDLPEVDFDVETLAFAPPRPAGGVFPDDDADVPDAVPELAPRAGFPVPEGSDHPVFPGDSGVPGPVPGEHARPTLPALTGMAERLADELARRRKRSYGIVRGITERPESFADYWQHVRRAGWVKPGDEEWKAWGGAAYHLGFGIWARLAGELIEKAGLAIAKSGQGIQWSTGRVTRGLVVALITFAAFVFYLIYR